MSGQKFKAGDLVQLKSGGPQMVVEQYVEKSWDSSHLYRCTWFSGAKHNSESFAEAALKPYEEKVTEAVFILPAKRSDDD